MTTVSISSDPFELGGGLAWNAVKAKVISATREVILIT